MINSEVEFYNLASRGLSKYGPLDIHGIFWTFKCPDKEIEILFEK